MMYPIIYGQNSLEGSEQLISKQADLGSSFPELGPAMREAVLVESGHWGMLAAISRQERVALPDCLSASLLILLAICSKCGLLKSQIRPCNFPS